MSAVHDIAEREERPAYVRFERRPIEDKQASIKEGRYIAKDVDFALVTPSYSKDCVEYKVETWITNMERNVRDGRIPEKWAITWKESLQRWKNGQEMPLNGTPIKGWGVIGPAQQSMLISINCLTVEDLAAINDEGLRRVGMGAVELRDKARTWLSSMQNHGEVTIKMASLEQENRNLKGSLDALKAQIEKLESLIPSRPIYQTQEMVQEITASELLDDPMQSMKGPDIPFVMPEEKRRGRPAKNK